LGRSFGPWALLFADDWDTSAGGIHFEASLLGFVWLLRVLHVPLSWRKCKGGKVYGWLGLEVNRREWTLGISERRAAWLLSWYDRVLHSKMILMRELREALGRMTFVYGTLVQDKAFLAPLFSFLNTHAPGACVELPLYVSMTLGWLRAQLARRRTARIAAPSAHLGCLFRVDAKAEGMAVAIGGWAPVKDGTGMIRKDLSPWFSIRLTPESAP